MIQPTQSRNIHKNSRLKLAIEEHFLNEQQVKGWKNQSPTQSTLPNHYKYLHLYPQLKQKRQKSFKVIPQMRAKSESEQIATTSLLSQSQKDVQGYQQSTKKLQTMLRMPNYLKMTENSAQKISPFPDKEEVELERHHINHKQKQKTKVHCLKYPTSPQRYISIPFYKSPSPEKEQQQNCVNVAQVYINTPALDQPFPPENCFYGTKQWKQAVFTGNKQRCSRRNIRKSISLSLCQITQKQDVKETSLSIAIKILAPMGKVRSTSLPLRIQHKIESFINAPSKRMKQHNKKDINKPKSRLKKMDSILMAPPKKRQKTEPKVAKQKQIDSKQSKFNVSNIFRRLDAIKKKYPALQAYDLQPRHTDLSINAAQKEDYQQSGNRLVQIRYKLMKTGLKLRRTTPAIQTQTQILK